MVFLQAPSACFAHSAHSARRQPMDLPKSRSVYAKDMSCQVGKKNVTIVLARENQRQAGGCSFLPFLRCLPSIPPTPPAPPAHFWPRRRLQDSSTKQKARFSACGQERPLNAQRKCKSSAAAAACATGTYVRTYSCTTTTSSLTTAHIRGTHLRLHVCNIVIAHLAPRSCPCPLTTRPIPDCPTRHTRSPHPQCLNVAFIHLAVS